jgi:oxygen-independent coproporphyrinogen-3 oxidase
MCDFAVSTQELTARFGASPATLRAMFEGADAAFDHLLDVTDRGLAIPPGARPLTRMIARYFDTYDSARARHSSAI